jgi:hypothetical protein
MPSTSEESIKMGKKVDPTRDERFPRSDGQLPGVENTNYEDVPGD